MADIPTTEPLAVVAGDTVRWTRTLPDYPAGDGWVLSYTLLNASAKISIASTASGDDHAVNVAATTTDDWAAGDYTWRATVARAGDVFTVATGVMAVLPSFAVATLDTRTFAAKALAAVEAYLADSNNLGAASYQIAGRQLSRYSLPDLLATRDRLKAEVQREEQARRVAAGLPDGRRVYVRFGA